MIARARLLLLVSLVVGIVIVATEFPFRQLLDERASVTRTSQQLRQLDAANRSLQAQVNAMHQPGTISAIAHQQYGLVQLGQRSVVVLPGGGTGGSGPLDSKTIPQGDVVPSDAVISPAGGGGVVREKTDGFWGRLLQRLEFWKAVP